MAKKQIIGKCHICGKTQKLSYEHVPPASAFNDVKTRVYNAMEIIGRNDKLPWEIEGIKSTEQQRGRGGYTLCIPCNSYTGLNYAKDYVQAAKCATDAKYSQYIKDGLGVDVALDAIHPLRLIKQILAMFASINSAGFFDKQTHLRSLVLDKELTGIDLDKYAIYVYYLKGGMGRNNGISGMMMNTGEPILISELSAPPFGFILELDPKRNSHGLYGAEITSMLNDFKYHDKDNIGFRMPLYEQNTPFPGDFRSKADIKGIFTEE